MAQTTLSTIITDFLRGVRARFAGAETIEGLGNLRTNIERELRERLDAADKVVSVAVTKRSAIIDAAQRRANKVVDDAQTRAAKKAAEADAAYAAGRAVIRAAVDAEVNAIEQSVRAAIRRAETLQTAGVAEKGAQEETVAKLRAALASLESI